MKLQQRFSLIKEASAPIAGWFILSVSLRRGLLRWRSTLSLTVMALPAILILLVLAYLPMAGIIVAFKNYMPYRGIFNSDWVGFQNFHFLFGTDQTWQITRNTVLMNLIFIVTGTLVALGIALLFNEIRDSSRVLFKIYQSAIFFPYFISWVIVGSFVSALLNHDSGVINRLLGSLHLPVIDWYASPQYWPLILTIVFLWKNVGFSALIYLSGIVAIDPEYYEAAQLDGASKWQQVRYITLPLLKPLIILLVILALGGIFHGDFGLFFMATGDHSALYPTTDVIDTYVYRALIKLDDFGMSSAAALYQAVVGCILVVLANWIVRCIDPDKAIF